MRLESIHANAYIESTSKKLEAQNNELRGLRNHNREIQSELVHRESEATINNERIVEFEVDNHR
jgi:hypothetical protein